MLSKKTRTAALLATSLAGAALALPAQSASAADGVYVNSASASGLSLGTTAVKTFTIRANVSTPTPADTEVAWTLESPNKDCYYYDYGDLTYQSGRTFSDRVQIAPTDVNNACAGPLVLTVSAYDFSGDYGMDDYATTVSLKRQARIVGTNASPEPVRKGGTVTVTGTLQRASWDDGKYHAYTGHKAQLQFRTNSGSYKTVKTVASSSGRLRTTATQKAAGCWRWSFAGSSATTPATGAGDCVKLR